MNPSSESPEQIYERLLGLRNEEVGRLLRRENLLGKSRLAVFLLGLLLLLADYQGDLVHPAWFLVPIGVFLLLVFLHDRTIQLRQRDERSVDFFRRGLDRLRDTWLGMGFSGLEYQGEGHPYADDFDLFGKGSLFELLCTAKTRIGRETLAGWLKDPASPQEVKGRQEGMKELKTALELREDLARAVRDPEDFAPLADLQAWGQKPEVVFATWERVVAGILSLLSLLSLAATLAGRWPLSPFLLIALLQAIVFLRFAGRVGQIEKAAEKASAGLSTYSEILKILETAVFESAFLRSLQAQIRQESLPASKRIEKLHGLVKRLEEGKRNQLFIPFARLLFWSTQICAEIERWRAVNGPLVGKWVASIGEWEALCALACHAYENPAHSFPEVVEGSPLLDAQGVAHPLLPRARAVANDFTLGGETRLVVLSGSNMSGKSTFLRTLGTNVILALAGGTVRADRMRLSPLRIGASIQIRDSLQEGVSKFFREITRVREILEGSKQEGPFLFFIDEIFQGTNSRDRRIAAEAIVRQLLDHGAMGLITTHDLTLTQIADRLMPLAINAHFEDQVVDGKIHFDYRLRPGIIRRGNALFLLKEIGVDLEGVEQDLGLWEESE